MNSFWSEAYGCQIDDGYELLKSFLQAQGKILGWEAARFLGFDPDAIQPLLQRLVEEDLAEAEGRGGTCFYRWRAGSPPPA